jgi:DNA repair protein REV1
MALHGGGFETYFSRDRVTHLVCANLPDTKLKQMAANPRKPVAVVRPEWVVASLRAGQLLPVRRARVDRRLLLCVRLES